MDNNPCSGCPSSWSKRKCSQYRECPDWLGWFLGVWRGFGKEADKVAQHDNNSKNTGL